jgi:hypothetical protein
MIEKEGEVSFFGLSWSVKNIPMLSLYYITNILVVLSRIHPIQEELIDLFVGNEDC